MASESLAEPGSLHPSIIEDEVLLEYASSEATQQDPRAIFRADVVRLLQECSAIADDGSGWAVYDIPTVTDETSPGAPYSGARILLAISPRPKVHVAGALEPFLDVTIIVDEILETPQGNAFISRDIVLYGNKGAYYSTSGVLAEMTEDRFYRLFRPNPHWNEIEAVENPSNRNLPDLSIAMFNVGPEGSLNILRQAPIKDRAEATIDGVPLSVGPFGSCESPEDRAYALMSAIRIIEVVKGLRPVCRQGQGGFDSGVAG